MSAAFRNVLANSLLPTLTGGLVLSRGDGHGANVARLYLWLALLAVPLSFSLVCHAWRGLC